MLSMKLWHAREVMERKGVDAIVASTYENCYYASGYKARPSARLIVTVVPADTSLDPAMIVASLIETRARQKSYIEDIRSYPIWTCVVDVDDIVGKTKKLAKPPEQFSPQCVLGMLTDVLKERGLHEGTIGIEKNLFTEPLYSLLSNQNPKARFVEAESIFWELRKVKTEGEVKALRMAAQLGVKGIQAVVEGNVVGATISALQCRYKTGVLQAATRLIPLDLEFLHTLISSGEPGTAESLEYQVAKGDIIFIDAGVQVFGYSSDMGRTFVVGKPSTLQKKIYKALRAGYEEGLSRVKPGLKMKEIYRVIHETVHSAGLDWFTRGHVGHMVGIGIGSDLCHIEQPPFISANEDTELEPNMVMTLEIGTYVTGLAAFQIEDMMLVTPDGYELLTHLPRDMMLL